MLLILLEPRAALPPGAQRLCQASTLLSCHGLQFYDVARKEIAALILSDDHPNVLRCFAMEEDEAFVYLALERCSQSLADLMQTDRGKFMDNADNPTEFARQVGHLD